MPFQNINASAVFPVFVLGKWVPEGTSVYDICLATEKVSGLGTIDGATLISGLWRVYPVNDVARIKILTKGVTFGNKLVQFEGVNPFSRRDGGVENRGTRLTISNLPFSYSNEAVERNLATSGFKLRSKIQFEKARGPDGKLTDWKTGRRFVWIDLPTHQVKSQCKMGEFRVFLFYREMKDSMKCRRCLETGHKALECPNEEVCFDCKKTGHRRGDAECESMKEVWGGQSGLEGNKVGEEKQDTNEEIYEEVSGDDSDDSSTTDEEESEREEGEVSEEEKPASGVESDQPEQGKEDETDTHEEEGHSHTNNSKYDNVEKVSELIDRVNESTPNSKIADKKGKESKGDKNKGKTTSDGKEKSKQKKEAKQNKQKQPTITSFVKTDGKRHRDETSSPGEGAHTSPDHKNAKNDLD